MLGAVGFRPVSPIPQQFGRTQPRLGQVRILHEEDNLKAREINTGIANVLDDDKKVFNHHKMKDAVLTIGYDEKVFGILEIPGVNPIEVETILDGKESGVKDIITQLSRALAPIYR